TALAVLKDEALLQRLYEARDNPQPDAGEVGPMGTADVVKVLSARLRQVDQAELPTGEKTRLTATLAEAVLRAIGVEVIYKPLEAMQGVLIGRKEEKR